MQTAPVRLVHASDLRIDRPLHGLPIVPDWLRDLLRDAARSAAERVFDTVLAENADALLLSGDVLDARRAAPRDVVFLVDHFRRLAKRGVRVFWAGGQSDPPDAWPPTARLPENVTVFPMGRVDSHELRRGGQVIAVVQGTSLPPEGPSTMEGFRRDPAGRFTVGVACATSDAAGKEGDRVHYLALGGRSRRATVDHDPGVAHYAGSPQGRGPADVGPSGCTVVQVDTDGKPKTRFVATDTLRWVDETVEFTAGTTVEQLRSRLRERLDKARLRSSGVDQLVRWRLSGVGTLVPLLRSDGLCAELLAELQAQSGRARPACWSWRVECDSPYEPPHELRDQETILGDLLRQVEVLRRSEAFALDLGELLPRPLPDASLASLSSVGAGAAREDLYQRAAKLGVALMTNEGATA